MLWSAVGASFIIIIIFFLFINLFLLLLVSFSFISNTERWLGKGEDRKEGRNGGVLDVLSESWYINERGLGGGKEKTADTNWYCRLASKEGWVCAVVWCSLSVPSDSSVATHLHAHPGRALYHAQTKYSSSALTLYVKALLINEFPFGSHGGCLLITNVLFMRFYINCLI